MAEIDNQISRFQREDGYGAPAAAFYNVINGFNREQGGHLVRSNLSKSGIAFFTRPQMNLSDANINQARRLHFLKNDNPNSTASAIRAMLDPEITQLEIGQRREFIAYGCDEQQAFIPMLSNALESLNGWPDYVNETYVSEEGVAKEVHGWVDSRADYNGQFDLTATFVNMQGNPITAMLAPWVEYPTRIKANDGMTQYPHFMINKVIDYSTRIYYFTMDETDTYITGIAMIGGGWPQLGVQGSSFNYDREQIHSQENNQITVPFKCFGCRYNDPYSIRAFNQTVEYFNPDMRAERRLEGAMVKLNALEKIAFNYKGYPYINDGIGDDGTHELEWWVSSDQYNEFSNEFNIPKYNEGVTNV